MSTSALSQSSLLLLAYLAVLLALSYPLGRYITRVAASAPIRGWGWLAKVEHGLYRAGGIRPEAEMGWKHYALALLVFSTLGVLSSMRCSACRPWLPLNPQGMAGVSARFVVQHRRQLRHQHQLAGLRRRERR